MKLTRKKISILGVPIDSFTKEESLCFIKNKINEKKPVFITTVNAEFLYAALNNQAVFKMLKNSTLNFADGVGVLWAAKFLSLRLPDEKFYKTFMGTIKLIGSLISIIFYPKYIRYPIPEKISGSDYIWDISNFAVENNLKIFLLGGKSTIPEQAALRLQTETYGLNVAGTYEGTPSEDDEKKIIEIINKSSADILFVAYGVPAEELWLERNLAKTGARIGIGVGGTFDFLAGRTKRAPKFFQVIGLEWLWRLILEPKRFKRQMALSGFIKRVFIHKLKS